MQRPGPILWGTGGRGHRRQHLFSGDLFTAGIVDNRIGAVVCVGEATGAGGANVWTSEDLEAAMRAAGHPFPLPKGVSFMVAVRRAVRSGDADGVLIEDAGITGQPYAMTRRDIFRRNQDLIEHCGEILAAQPRTRLRVARRPSRTGDRHHQTGPARRLRGRPSRRPVGAPSRPRFHAAAGAPRSQGRRDRGIRRGRGAPTATTANEHLAAEPTASTS